MLKKLAILISVFMIYPTFALAYIDPGLGSMIIQGIIAASVAGMAYLYTIKEKTLAFYKKLKEVLFKKDKK